MMTSLTFHTHRQFSGSNPMSIYINRCKPNRVARWLLLLWGVLVWWAMPASGQQPVNFSVDQRQLSPGEFEVAFASNIASGWHVYSTQLPAGGPTSASLVIEQQEGVTPVGTLRAEGQEQSHYDRLYGMTLRYFEGHVRFVQRFRATAPQYRVSGYLEYAACNAQNCLPPAEVEFSYSGTAPSAAPAATPPSSASSASDRDASQTAPDAATAADPAAAADLQADNPATDSIPSPVASTDTVTVADSLTTAHPGWWQPVTAQLQQQDHTNDSQAHSLPWLLLMGFVGGLLALLTPCVWPVIPMTVSFFLRQSDNRRRAVSQAVGYGLSIMAVFLLIGAAVMLAGRADWLNALSTSAVFNLLLCLLLVIFACSFFGWFELALPARWTDAVDSRATAATGWLSVFLMALTLVLVSFSCTAPIVGLLLVETATATNRWAPLLGMTGFALALALPFTLFALFPAWLRRLPRSGGWMNLIKVTLGFIELAFACKFFSVADLAYGWRLLDREVFLALWTAIFLLLGTYLVGLYRFPGDDPEPAARPVPAILAGLASVAFSLYLLPGLWGAPCKAVSAFAPPLYTQDFRLSQVAEVRPRFTDYDAAMACAQREGKPVLVDFSGFGCVNCRKMESAVWTDEQVARRLRDDFVLVSLYVDDKTPLPQPLQVTLPDGSQRRLRTVGDRWAYLEQTKFGRLSQPFYVALDPQGQPLAGSYAYDESVSRYLQFLDNALNAFR